MLNFAGLEDDIAVRQDHGPAQARKPFQYIEGGREQPIGEGVVHQERRHREKLYIARVLRPVALESSDIVAIAQLREQILKDPPITLAGGDAKGALEMVLEVLLYRVVVEQRVVDIDEEDERIGGPHVALPSEAGKAEIMVRRRFDINGSSAATRHAPDWTASKA